MSKDFYNTLGVSRSASADEIKKAYRKLAMQYHPDRNAGDQSAEQKFKDINEAYEVLKDPQKKAAYDRYGSDAFSNGGFGNNGFGGGGYQSGGFDFTGAGSFQDIFEDIFDVMGGRSSRSSPHRAEIRGDDLQYNTTLTLEEAFSGKKIKIPLRTHVRCTGCGGYGSEGGAKAKPCPACKGSGRTRFSQGFFTVERTCPSCNGLGQIIENSCKTCAGSGRVVKSKTIEVSIPAGVDNGSRIRVAGEGEAGIRGGASGDLYVYVSVKPHAIFDREGSTIHCTFPISMTDAALGSELEVPTIDGKKLVVTVPAGTQNGQLLKLKGKGMPELRTKVRGDMIVHMKVMTPVNLTTRQKELLREFAKEYEPHPQSEGFFSTVREFWNSFNN